MSFLRSQAFRLTFISIILLEMLSFIGWARPELGNIIMIVLLIGALLLSLKDLRYGVALVLIELVIGSHGYLFSYGAGDLALSLRLGLFLVVMTAFLFHVYKTRRIKIVHSNYFWWLLVFAIAVVFATIWGVIQGNGLANVFFDGNAFLFYALAFPFWQAIRQSEDWILLVQVGFAALLASIAKVFFLLYAFSHKLWWMLPETYKWVRDTRVGEITQVTDSFYRIFFASQIYTILGLFILVLFFFKVIQKGSAKQLIRNKTFWFHVLTGGAIMGSFLISFSRSNWLGAFCAFLLFLVYIVLTQKQRLATLRSTMVSWILFGMVGLGLIAGTVLFPFPNASGEFAAGSLFSSRAFSLSGEAGLSSRWQLLVPLWQAVKEQPILGAGFGKNITYITEDPRIRAQNPSGEYTTFVFEWGYLDLWLKLGLIGLIIYAGFALQTLKNAWGQVKHWQILDLDWQKALALSFFFSGIALCVVHAFSPYFNHPLGIAFLLFWALSTETLGQKLD